MAQERGDQKRVVAAGFVIVVVVIAGRREAHVVDDLLMKVPGHAFTAAAMVVVAHMGQFDAVVGIDVVAGGDQHEDVLGAENVILGPGDLDVGAAAQLKQIARKRDADVRITAAVGGGPRARAPSIS